MPHITLVSLHTPNRSTTDKCPFRNRQAQDFLQKSNAFVQVGAHVVMMYPGPSPDHNAHAKEFMADKTLPNNFDLLLDPGYKFTNLYGVRWDAPRETAYPSTFLIDRDGIVLFTKVVKEHGGRTRATEILDVLPKEKAASGSVARPPRRDAQSIPRYYL